MKAPRISLSIVILTLIVFAGLANASKPDNPKVDDVIAKHLNSIGSEENRSSKRSRLAVGTAQLSIRSRGTSQAAGNAVLASLSNKSMITMKFGVPEYPYEKLGFDGSDVTAYAIRPGVYTTLGGFARTYSTILKDGLLGGTLSAAWPLLDLSNKKAKLEYGGIKKVNARQLIEIRYVPKGGSDLNIALYFDAENYQHVRTVYKKTVEATLGGGGIDSSASQNASRYELVEEFSDFKDEKGLMLPHTYEIHYKFTGAESRYYDYVVSLQSFVFDQAIDAKDFNVAN
jgi:hypothetical protein